MNPMPMLCLPYAGGSAQFYKRWTNPLQPFLTPVPIEMSGRGSRIEGPLIDDVHKAVDDLLPAIIPYTKQRYALFGHSMGCLVAFELMHRLRQEGLPLPEVAFMSGRGAPHLLDDKRDMHLLPDEQFVAKVKEMGGTPDEFFQHPELLQLFLPILRADFKLVADYRYAPRAPLPIDLFILNGESDTGLIGEARDWQRHTTGVCETAQFYGGHFYLHEPVGELTGYMTRVARRVPAGAAD
ncbi:thioesterase II family protein [Paenibacillus sp. GCM10027627]|uniref:thioesterase II family protein n=1 Tax=unclassified Paenibacillus TaxID=185978 RepID=UPI003628DCE4